jgi:pimeloyl-ACP methyl ester carboxylesterase
VTLVEIGEFVEAKKAVRVPQGEVAYFDAGEGPVALFVHGVFMNSLLWRNAIAELSPDRRCIAPDLPAHGGTQVDLGGTFSLDAHAAMLVDFLEALGIDRVDLVGNDTGGAISQAFAVRYPERLRTLTLTNCDVDKNFPPDAFKPAIELATKGELAPMIAAIATDLDLARSDAGLGVGYERPGSITSESAAAFLGRYTDPAAGKEIEKRIASVAEKDLQEVTTRMRELHIPTLVVWGTKDDFFALEWAYWLKDNVPGVSEVVEIEGGKLFFVDERGDELATHLRRHWAAHPDPAVTEGVAR